MILLKLNGLNIKVCSHGFGKGADRSMLPPGSHFQISDSVGAESTARKQSFLQGCSWPPSSVFATIAFSTDAFQKKKKSKGLGRGPCLCARKRPPSWVSLGVWRAAGLGRGGGGSFAVWFPVVLYVLMYSAFFSRERSWQTHSSLPRAICLFHQLKPFPGPGVCDPQPKRMKANRQDPHCPGLLGPLDKMI